MDEWADHYSVDVAGWLLASCPIAQSSRFVSRPEVLGLVRETVVVVPPHCVKGAPLSVRMSLSSLAPVSTVHQWVSCRVGKVEHPRASR